MSHDLTRLNVVVKNTFLQFGLKDSAWHSEKCRRASVGAFFGSGQEMDSDRGDTCEAETGSTTGSDRPSLLASLETESSRGADLDGDVNTMQPFYCTECDDWDMPQAAEELQQKHSLELAAQYVAVAPMQTMEPFPFYFQPPPTYGQSQQTFLSTAPSNTFTSMPAVTNECVELGSECPFAQALVDPCRNDSLSRSPRRKQMPESALVQIPADSRQCDSLSCSPRRKQVSGCNSPSSPKKKSEYTTIILRNLPNDYNRDMLVELLSSRGFGNSYNFLYLPFDFKRGAGLGYAFVNMVSHKQALRAMEDLEGFHNWKLRSSKVLQVTWSTPLQGLEANIERYRNSPVMHPDVPDQFKPLLVSKGVPIDFPAPTKLLPSPNH